MTRQQPAPAPELDDETVPRPNPLEEREYPRGACIGVEPEAEMVHEREIRPVIGRVGGSHIADDGVVPIVRQATAEDCDSCLDIVRSLPDYFTPDVPETVRRDLTVHDAWVVVHDDLVVGFGVVDRRTPPACEILWAAVVPERRGEGLGTQLVNEILDALARDGVRVVEVKTLDRSAGYPPYESTLAFWEGRGFMQIDTIDPLPGWQPGNPSAIYVLPLPRI